MLRTEKIGKHVVRGVGHSCELWHVHAGADLEFYKGGCPIHLKGAPLPQLFWPMLPGRNQTIFFVLEEIGPSWRQAVVRHLELCQNPLLSSYSSCFVFTKHPVQLKTVTSNDMFSKYVLFKKGT